MAIHIVPIRQDDYPILYEIALDHDPTLQDRSFAWFSNTLDKRTGWTIFSDTETIGAFTMDSLIENVDVAVHCFVSGDYHGRWATRSVLRKIFRFIFNDMGLLRCSTYGIPGVTDKAITCAMAMGFMVEGTRRRVAQVNGNYLDTVLFGMLKEECRWL